MLTREEAKKIRDAFGEVEVWAGCPGCAKLKEKVGEVRHVILELTEKPKREIKVGDIYLAEGCNPQMILKLKGDEIISWSSIYDLKGRWISASEEHLWGDLDLSKCYKLVEVEDE